MSEQIPQAAVAAGDSLVVTFTREQIDALLRLPGERHDHGAHRDGPCYGCADFDARKRLRYPTALPSIRKEVLREAREALKTTLLGENMAQLGEKVDAAIDIALATLTEEVDEEPPATCKTCGGSETALRQGNGEWISEECPDCTQPVAEVASTDGGRGEDDGWPEMVTGMRVVDVPVGPFWYSGDRLPPPTPGAEVETRRYVRIDLDKLWKVEDELAAATQPAPSPGTQPSVTDQSSDQGGGG